jgi:tetratricopeptide (TPR) repeat protein
MEKTNNNFASPAPVLTYARLLRKLHELIAAGEGDSIEAEALADEMDDPWYAMTDREQHRTDGLSVDLYALREGGPKRVDMSPEQLEAWQKAVQEAYEKSELGDPDALLDFFRQPIPSNLPPHAVPYLQARCWQKLGDLETALHFMKEAERYDPDQTTSGHVLFLLYELWKAKDGLYAEEAKEYAERIINRKESSPKELYMATATLLRLTRTQTVQEAAPTLRSIISTLHRALKAYLLEPSQKREGPNLDQLISYIIGVSFERLGDSAHALEAYSAALTRNPFDSELLVARGLARYWDKKNEAMKDFLAAIQLGARSIWPWHILARHALAQGNFGEALRLGLRATERTGLPQLLAEAHETVALALAMLGQPHARVLRHFTEAARLDPANDRIRRNLDLAQNQGQHAQAVREWRRNLTVPQVEPGLLQQDRNAKMADDLEEVRERQNAKEAPLGLLAA